MRLWPFIILLCAASTALGQEEARIVETRSLPVGQGSAGASHTLRLWLHVFRGGRWSPEEVASAVRGAADMLRQCGVALSRAELRVVQAPQRYRWYSTARARELLARLPVPKPAVFFVDDTLNDPAFDAEAIGRANATSSSISCPTVGPQRGAGQPDARRHCPRQHPAYRGTVRGAALNGRGKRPAGGKLSA